MNKEAEAILNKIVIKEVAALTPFDIAFLNARATYLTDAQLEKYGSVLNFVTARNNETIEDNDQDIDLSEKTIDFKTAQKNKLNEMKYNDLLNLAKELGFIQKKGKPARKELEIYVSQNT